MNFVDAIEIAGTRKRTEDGALVVDARVARTGIQVYAGYEVGKPELSAVRVFRGADEVFHRDSLASFAHRPVTNDHPRVAVTTENWKDVAVGQTADEVTATDIFVRVPMLISDAATIAAIDSGKRELSAGYTCDLDWTPGITAKGETFDARQRNIRVNHIAVVDRGRAGKDCRIGDAWGVTPINDQKEPETMSTKTMIVDGLPILVTDQSEAMINRLLANNTKLVADHQAALSASTALVADRDKTIGELTVKVKALEDAAMTPERLDAIVKDRAILVDTARKIVPDLKVEGLNDAAIRKSVVETKYGADFVKDASDDMITGMFNVLTKAAPAPTNDAFRQAVTQQTVDATRDPNGQAAYERRLQDAWKSEPAGKA